MRSFSPFLWIGTTFAFFHRLGKVFLSLQLLNMIDSGFTILLSHSFNILMDTSSCPWALLISNVLIILCISSSSILKDYGLVSVIYVWFSDNYDTMIHNQTNFLSKWENAQSAYKKLSKLTKTKYIRSSIERLRELF